MHSATSFPSSGPFPVLFSVQHDIMDWGAVNGPGDVRLHQVIWHCSSVESWDLVYKIIHAPESMSFQSI